MSVAGIDPTDYPGGSKEKLVGDALRAATDEDAVNLSTELVDLLQLCNLFESDDDIDIKYRDRLRESFATVGARLDRWGNLKWSSAASGPEGPGKPPPLTHPATRDELTFPPRNAPRDSENSDSAGPSLDFLAETLRRLPAAARPLVGERTHDRASIPVRDEYDAQAFVHVALRLLYVDVRPEEPAPSSAGKASRIDFLVRDQRIAVEVKVTSPSHGERNIRKEIIEDKHEYRTHPHVTQLLVVVFDLFNKFSNPVGFEYDLSETVGGLRSVVVVAPWPAAARGNQ